jgi:hypothetical protein
MGRCAQRYLTVAAYRSQFDASCLNRKPEEKQKEKRKDVRSLRASRLRHWYGFKHFIREKLGSNFGLDTIYYQ